MSETLEPHFDGCTCASCADIYHDDMVRRERDPEGEPQTFPTWVTIQVHNEEQEEAVEVFKKALNKLNNLHPEGGVL